MSAPTRPGDYVVRLSCLANVGVGRANPNLDANLFSRELEQRLRAEVEPFACSVGWNPFVQTFFRRGGWSGGVNVARQWGLATLVIVAALTPIAEVGVGALPLALSEPHAFAYVATVVVRLTQEQISSDALRVAMAAVASRFTGAHVTPDDIDVSSRPFGPGILLTNDILNVTIQNPNGTEAFRPYSHSNRPGLDRGWALTPLCTAGRSKVNDPNKYSGRAVPTTPDTATRPQDLTVARPGQEPPFPSPEPMETSARTPPEVTKAPPVTMEARKKAALWTLGAFSAALVVAVGLSAYLEADRVQRGQRGGTRKV